MFVHLDNVDQAGHTLAWYRKQYYAAVKESEGYVGEILDRIDALRERQSTFVLITSHRGGESHQRLGPYHFAIRKIN